MDERWRPNVTVAAVASRLRGGEPHGPVEYLLVEEETPEGLRLNNPAGHLEAGESPQQAVVREALEETARAFRPERLLGVYLSRQVRPDAGADTTYLRLAFLGSVGEADPARRLDDGVVRTLWQTLDELRGSQARHRSPLLLRCCEDAAAGRGFALEAVVTDPSVLAGAPHRP